MAGLRDHWHSLPPLYRKRLWQAGGAYVALMAVLIGWVAVQNDKAQAARQAQIPHIESDITAVYLNPQLTDIASPTFSLTDAQTATEPGAILLVMADMGLAKSADARAIDALPAPVVLAFSPYGKYVAEMTPLARKDGHTVAALVPMEPITYPTDDPGPLALLTRHSVQDNERMMDRILAAVPNATVAMNYMGSRYLGDADNAGIVLQALADRKMTFIETPAAFNSPVGSVAQERGVAALKADVLIDDEATEDSIRTQLSELERISRQRGVAVGIVHPYPLTFALLSNWLPTLPARNLKLVSLEDALAQPEKTAAPAPALTPVLAPANDEAPPPPPPAPASIKDAAPHAPH